MCPKAQYILSAQKNQIYCTILKKFFKFLILSKFAAKNRNYFINCGVFYWNTVGAPCVAARKHSRAKEVK